MIEVRGLHLRQGDFALCDISFQIAAGSYAVVVGESGSGKTSLLEAILGLRAVDSGMVRINDRDITTLPPERRAIGYVPQSAGLFPSMRVRDQIGFGLRSRGGSRQAIEQRVTQLAGSLGIGSLLHRRPQGLSGGEQARVALARALAIEPAVLLLDEPVASVDALTCERINTVIRDFVTSHQATVMHVTHRLEEIAMASDAVIRVGNGNVFAGPP